MAAEWVYHDATQDHIQALCDRALNVAGGMTVRELAAALAGR